MENKHPKSIYNELMTQEPETYGKPYVKTEETIDIITKTKKFRSRIEVKVDEEEFIFDGIFKNSKKDAEKYVYIQLINYINGHLCEIPYIYDIIQSNRSICTL